MTVEERVRRVIAERREAVNEAVPEELPIERPETLYRASRHLLDAGGKRLRPAVSLLVAESLAGGNGEIDYRAVEGLDGAAIDVMAGAISIEVVHLFTLIHDDIMDDDDLRRGVPAVHREFDEDIAILAGDTLYSTAFEIMLDTGVPPERGLRAMDRLATTCTEICEGQAFDIGFEDRGDVSIGEYEEMIELKTAVLYGAAASIPAILLGADDGTVESLYRYGIDVGSGFQIQDDVLDLVGSSETLGKRRGSDLIEGKRTLITVHAREQGIDVENLVGDDPDAVTEAEIEAAVDTLADAGSIAFARERATERIERGKDHLAALPDNQPRRHLRDIADFLVERDH